LGCSRASLNSFRSRHPVTPFSFPHSSAGTTWPPPSRVPKASFSPSWSACTSVLLSACSSTTESAGLYKLPDLLGPLGNHVRGQTVVASIVAGFAAYGAVRFLARWFKSHTLWPFGLYCIILGSYCLITLK